MVRISRVPIIKAIEVDNQSHTVSLIDQIMLQKKTRLDIKELKDNQEKLLKEPKKKNDCPLFDVKKTSLFPYHQKR